MNRRGAIGSGRPIRSAFAFVLEGDADARPISFDLPVLELHVELDDFRDSQVAQCLAGANDRGRSCLLPRLRAGSYQLDYLVDIFRHDNSPTRYEF